MAKNRLNSRFFIDDEEEMRKIVSRRLKKIDEIKERAGLKRSDLYRIGVIAILLIVFLVPKIRVFKEYMWQKEFSERWDYFQAKYDEEEAERIKVRSQMSSDERFVEYVKKSAEEEGFVIDTIINEEDNAIYILVSANGNNPELWEARIEYQKAMAVVAAGSHVEKKVIVAGIKENKEYVWMIQDGNIIEFGKDEGGEEADV